jgi:hypothetical protein
LFVVIRSKVRSLFFRERGTAGFSWLRSSE